MGEENGRPLGEAALVKVCMSSPGSTQRPRGTWVRCPGRLAAVLTKMIEVTNGPWNWGKFLLARPDTEWERGSCVNELPQPLLKLRGWTPQHLWVLDLETGEGAFFLPGGHAGADLNKHRIWVCPLFEPFLTWLYTQDLADLKTLPDHVGLHDAPFILHGHRRSGPGNAGGDLTG